MKNIIIATDFSGVALNAAHYAASLAQKAGAQLLIYHAFQYPVPEPDLPSTRKKFDEAYSNDKKKAEKLQQALTATYHIKVEYILDPEPIMEKLPTLVKQQQAGLVILGISGSNPLKRFFFGSTTISLLRVAKYPILVVPEAVKYKNPENILLAYLPQLLQKESVLASLRYFADLFQARVHILKIRIPRKREDGVDKDASIRELYENLNIPNHVYMELEAKGFMKGIELGYQETNADLLITVPGRHMHWEDYLKYSNTRKIVERMKMPLLAIPNV